MEIRYILLSAGILAASMPAVAGPVARWKSVSHDFGAFDEDMGKVSSDFVVVNDGDAPLMIYAARASCGCTVPSFTSDPVAPGDSAVIKVTYDPTGRPGKFSKKVKVETNCDPAQNILTINGVVIGASNTLRARFPVEVGNLKLRNKSVAFGDINKGNTKTAFLDGYNQSNDTICPVVTGLPPHITVTTSPEAVPPGEQVTFTFFYNSARTSDWGLTSDEVSVTPAAGSAESQPVDLIAVVNEDFSRMTPEKRERAPKIALSSTSIDLGQVAVGTRNEEEIIIENFGKDPLVIRKVASLDPAVQASVNKTEVKGGSNARIKVKVDTRKVEGDIVNARITVITNDPDRPVSNIRVVGELLK